MATKIFCDICGKECTDTQRYTVRITAQQSNDPYPLNKARCFLPEREDVCGPCIDVIELAITDHRKNVK